MQPIRFQDLTLEDQFLLDEAERAMKNAYVPYSKFQVGAAARSVNKRVYLGATLESSSAGAVICAERAALAWANTSADRAIEVLAIIGTSTESPSIEPVTPCGICRQTLFEFADVMDRDILVICSDIGRTKIVVGMIRELLPRPFNSRTLAVDLGQYRPTLPTPHL